MKLLHIRQLFSQSHNEFIPRAVLLLGLLSTFIVSWIANNSLSERQALHFEDYAEDLVDRIDHKVRLYPAVLRGTRGLFDTYSSISAKTFETYVDSINVAHFYPGIQGIGFAPLVLHKNLENFIRYAKENVSDNYEIVPNNVREQYFPIVYLEPKVARNQLALGYDMFTEPTRHAAMELARDSGFFAISGIVTLRQDMEERNNPVGFLMYVPYYLDLAKNLTTVESRREKFAGFIYSPFRAHDFFSVTLDQKFKNNSIEVYDSAVEPKNLLYASNATTGQTNCLDCFSTVKDLTIGGRTWKIKLSGLGLKNNPDKWLVFALCIGQIFLVCIIWKLAQLQNKTHQRVIEANKEKEILLTSEREARTTAEKIARVKDEFLAVVSHELRSPLNAILGWTQLILKPNVNDEHIKRGLETIKRNANLQAQLIEDLLDTTRINSGKLKLRVEEVRLSSIIDAAIDTVKPDLDAKSIAISKNFLVAQDLVLVDASRLQQVIWNILSNAIKFSPASSEIKIRTYLDKKSICIGVIDSGSGIPKDFIPIMFDSFRQADASTTRKHGGLGLGLAISKHIMQLHGGDIKAENTNHGAEFTVCLPKELIRLSDSKNVEDLQLIEEKQLRGINILVVDDENDSREITQRVLEEFGITVHPASSVDQALEALEKYNFTLIISDLGMPVTDGFEFARRVREHKKASIKNIPMIALSALTRDTDQVLAKKAGFNFHLAKPLEIFSLTKTISKLLQKTPSSIS